MCLSGLSLSLSSYKATGIQPCTLRLYLTLTPRVLSTPWWGQGCTLSVEIICGLQRGQATCQPEQSLSPSVVSIILKFSFRVSQTRRSKARGSHSVRVRVVLRNSKCSMSGLRKEGRSGDCLESSRRCPGCALFALLAHV